MRPRVATVLTARPWEQLFVEAARRSARIRIVSRAYAPIDIAPDRVDVVVAGAETAWVSPALVANLRRAGCRVLGLHPPGDGPAQRLLTVGGADAVLPDSTSPDELIDCVQFVALESLPAGGSGGTIAVTGPGGAPGRTETAVALAAGLAANRSCLLIDLDADGPSLSLRFGMPPEPSVLDSIGDVRTTGRIPSGFLRQADRVTVLTGAFGHRHLPVDLARDVIHAAQADFPWVVFDAGPTPGAATIRYADHVVFVCDAGPVGIVRAAEAFHTWDGAPPLLVLNRVDGDAPDTRRAVRRATGLEPVASVPFDASVRLAGLSGAVSLPAFARGLAPLVMRLLADPAGRVNPDRL